MFPQWVNQETFYTYIYKLFEYNYAKNQSIDIRPLFDEITKDMNEIEKREYLIQAVDQYDQVFIKISKDGEAIHRKLDTYRDLKYYSNQIYTSLPNHNNWSKSKVLKKYQRLIASLIRDTDYQDIESDPALLNTKVFQLAERIGDTILDHQEICDYVLLFFTEIDPDKYLKSEVANILHGYFILLQHYFCDPNDSKNLELIRQAIQESNQRSSFIQFFKQLIEPYFKSLEQLEDDIKILSGEAKSKQLHERIQKMDIEQEIVKYEQNRTWIEAMIDEYIQLNNELIEMFADSYFDYKERIHQKCESYYFKYFSTNQEEKEKIQSYMIFAEAARRSTQEEYDEFFSMNANKRNYPFLEQINHYCFYDTINAFIEGKVEFEQFAPRQYTHRFINLYLQIFSKMMFDALVYAYRANPEYNTYLVFEPIEKDLFHYLKNNQRSKLNYDHFVVEMTRFNDYPITLRNTLVRIYPDHQKIIAAIYCLLIDFDKNCDFFYQKLKLATDPDLEEYEDAYFYPINQKKSELAKNTLELEKEKHIDRYINLNSLECFNAIYNFIELYKQDPITLASSSHLNRIILQIIKNMDDPSALSDHLDYMGTLESKDYDTKTTPIELPELDLVEKILKEEDKAKKKLLLRTKVVMVIKELINLPRSEAEEYYRIAFNESLFLQKTYSYKELGMHIFNSLEDHILILNDNGNTLATLITKYILEEPDTVFGAFFTLSKKKQYVLLFFLTMFDHYYSVEASTIFSVANSNSFLNEEDNHKLAKKYQLLQKEVSKYEGKQKETKQQYNALKDENDELKRQLAYYKKKEKETKDLVKPYELKINQLTSQYTKQIDSLNKQIQSYETQTNELNKLRELVFNHEKQIEEMIEDHFYEQEFLKEFCNTHHVVLAGGRFELQRALKNMLGIIPYGNHFSSNSDVLKNADYIFISYKWFNHSDYAIIQNIVSTNPQIEWDYLQHDNINLVIHDLYQLIHKKK